MCAAVPEKREVRQNNFYDFRTEPKNQDLYYQRFDARGRHEKFVLQMLGILQRNFRGVPESCRTLPDRAVRGTILGRLTLK